MMLILLNQLYVDIPIDLPVEVLLEKVRGDQFRLLMRLEQVRHCCFLVHYHVEGGAVVDDYSEISKKGVDGFSCRQITSIKRM